MDINKSWHNEIDFRCKFGMWPFQRTLEITTKGFIWCGELFPMKTIDRLRWGVDLRRGGVFPKRVYIVTFGTKDNEFTIKTKQKDFYEHLTDKYWKAVGKRILNEMIEGLRAGNKYTFAGFTVEDRGIKVNNKPIFGQTKQLSYEWKELKWGTVNGSLCFASLKDPDDLIAGCSFLWTDNAHVLNVAMGLLQNSKDKTRLSSCIL